MTQIATKARSPKVSLDDKWTRESGRVVMNGSQAIVRTMLEQKRRDSAAGLNTAGYVTGYRGSPLGNVDTAMWSAGKYLQAADVLFRPGVNEDLAATAVRGTQQLDAVEGARFDGVFAAWYGKGPGVDRSGDAFKHGNYAGTHRNGGVIAYFGDDHVGKSSTVSHQSEQAMAASSIPCLYPANVEELLDHGLMAIAMSRYCGLWVGVKCVTEVAEQTANVDLDMLTRQYVLPETDDATNVHMSAGTFNPLGEERVVVEHRLPRAQAFVRANRIDRTIFDPVADGIGIVASGKSYGDTRSALELLGIDEARARALGVSLYKVGCIWPLEPAGLTEFAERQAVLLFIEEKKAFLEAQAAAHLINMPGRPLFVGKQDEDGQALFSTVDALEPVDIAKIIVGRLDRLGRADRALHEAAEQMPASQSVAGSGPAGPKRAPYFCSGCPHNRSTKVPEGSTSMTGIGCHTMVNFVRPDIALLPTQMGAEGTNWVGLAPFVDTPHMFQNLGDGTYFHSGLMAIRAAVAAGTNITYKILYNDAVAMTGGQPVDGSISVAEIARQVQAEGVVEVIVLSDDPDRHRNTGLPANVRVGHRDELDAVQRHLREVKGTSVLIYEQTCAAEKRRRRKRGQFPDPAKRLFIAKEVCEGCGDCSVQSTCVSLTPVETAMGRKREIDQSSCNKDYSCLNGFCPSFITVRGAEPRKPSALEIDEARFAAIPTPPVAPLDQDGFDIIVAGIGGTGVVTVGALIGMAAHMEGKRMSLFDMTGLSQKNGAVYSHVRISDGARRPATQRIARGGADLLLAFDMVAGTGAEAVDTLRMGKTRAIANTDLTATVAFQFDRSAQLDRFMLLSKFEKLVGKDAICSVDASSLARKVLGDTIGANMFMVGIAAQMGLLPVGVEALESAIELNGVSVGFNRKALHLGRLYVSDPAFLESLTRSDTDRPEVLPTGLDEIVAHRSAHLEQYQNAALASSYRALVSKVADAERAVAPQSEDLAVAVALNYAKLLAYKDEYEVARLLTSPKLREELDRTFADGGRISFNMAPPILNGGEIDGRPRKREFGPWILPVLRVMARMKRLRGSVLDPFARNSERKRERALIAEYEALVEETVARLTATNLPVAVKLLSLADMIRGFGPVKDAAIDQYSQTLRTLEARVQEGGQAQTAPAPVMAPTA